MLELDELELLEELLDELEELDELLDELEELLDELDCWLPRCGRTSITEPSPVAASRAVPISSVPVAATLPPAAA